MKEAVTQLPEGRTSARSMRWLWPIVICAIIGIASVLLLDLAKTDYAFLAAYTVLQFVALATAWNILGGYAGYVNFGVAGFFAVGVYTSVFIYKTLQWPLVFTIPLAAVVAGLLGLGMGYLTLRLRGVFFSIATLAMSVVLNTLVVNWSFVGGSRGVYILHSETIPFFGTYARYLFVVMLILAMGSVLIARFIENSWIGNGLAALKDDEMAAECAGVPSLRMKLFATTVSGALLGAIGAPFPYFVTYVDPSSAFSLTIAVNAIAMPLIGGTATWLGPVIGALLLGTLQQVATVTISSALNLLIVGVLLVIFIAVAPNGIIGFIKDMREKRK
ncbi:branched-chain amino acid ABC transporter permease [Bradyrhizobium sp. SYSU BS000235]|uniref:branched-chain amino acid ABC transporter permease n=1 Tax=Bradyrhizobium sp. SYSU BS000235 TaxID=3411332 RepID=UPI003C7969DA